MAMQEREAWLNCLFCFINSKVVRWGPIGICLVGLEALHTLSCLIAGPFLDQGVLGPHPETSLRTPPNTTSQPSLRHNKSYTTSNSSSESSRTSYSFLGASKEREFIEEMKMDSSSMAGSKRRISSNRGLGGVLREQRARLYIIRRCVVMLLCWHD